MARFCLSANEVLNKVRVRIALNYLLNRADAFGRSICPAGALGRHHRHEFLGGPFSDAMGAGICVVQVGDQLICPDGATPGVQARHSRGLSLAWTRHQHTARGLAAGEAEEARESGSLLDASEVANVVTFMLTRPRGMTIRDVVMLPTNFDL